MSYKYILSSTWNELGPFDTNLEKENSVLFKMNEGDFYNKKYASKHNYFDETQVTSPGL